MIFINPKTKYAFKKIFGSSESKEILISFLNALIYEGNSTIEDLEIINPNLPRQLADLKDTYLDVTAKLDDGTLVIIEILVLNVQYSGNRVLYNAATTYAFQLQRGEGYRMLKPLIALTITDFEMFRNSPNLISRFVYKEVESNLNYPEDAMNLVFIELPKFHKEASQLETLTDKWIYFMKYARMLSEVPETIDSVPEIHKAFDLANQARLSREEVEVYERKEQFIHDQQGAIIKAVEEARQAGIQAAREQRKREETLAIAQQLLSQLDNGAIAQVTGLSVEDVQNLRGDS
ncbi:MAG: Rpn family recombination-promoting nuclease/putative transposase [Oscillatoriales cyanobacterium]|uniref:Rpn family recombination-promoting nuclease/putative transposase n=1 Tax=Microcoleus sp. PH2017_05_CCC_O_A TaxID=2798816 RepID=UPI001D532590|nr:Rpn family recombination-promoting nuclease/putative transposase [Microcoleus sp. PH2017_05_CCC_O_A]TAG00496.1 MAG: Rpn family recombination-promoting nuclease/putative transposase [Oscillatoriales cyanobacterium]MCC3435119.1 Rpn family recombination-promoting nuclease/putative transposase [Microcoleus sp. PH2017_05_CCC_O_A]TAG13353.1 MAG: Rpn family recombination-promoting nuclease/putative transposase [Oscillatoriales cyanobacterium]TAG36949.1 MAG: Rpn family recombination-promoting nuclea